MAKRLKISEDSATKHYCKPIIQECDKDLKAWPSYSPFRNKCDGGHEIYGINELGKTKYWFFPNDSIRKEMQGGGVSFLNFLLIRYSGCQVEDFVWSKRYSEWCNENSYDKKSRPRNYTFKEWVKFKEGHLDISRSVRKDLFRLWVIDRFTEASDPDKNPLKRCFDEYKWVFHSEIEELADEYEIKNGEKGQILEDIWKNVKELDVRIKISDMITESRSWEAIIKTGLTHNHVVCSLEALTRLNSSTWATKWFKRLVAYAKCNRDSYESELGDKELAGRRR
ncbi:hypothetical protein Tco_0522449 [Tanacetum coccineum]